MSFLPQFSVAPTQLSTVIQWEQHIITCLTLTKPTTVSFHFCFFPPFSPSPFVSCLSYSSFTQVSMCHCTAATHFYLTPSIHHPAAFSCLPLSICFLSLSWVELLPPSFSVCLPSSFLAFFSSLLLPPLRVEWSKVVTACEWMWGWKIKKKSPCLLPERMTCFQLCGP